MYLVDTSIWIDHFRRADIYLSAYLSQRRVLLHPFVFGELALGHVPRLNEMIDDLSDLPAALVARPTEVLKLISMHNLAGSGIGYADAHLVASALLLPDAKLWTRDRKLHAVADRLAIARQA